MLSTCQKRPFFIALPVHREEPAAKVRVVGGPSHLKSVSGISAFAMKPVIPIQPAIRIALTVALIGKTG